MSFAAAGKCTISGKTVHLTGVGTCTITASQAGDGVWKPAASVARTFAIHLPAVTNDAPAVQYSDSSHVTVSATDAASQGSALTAVATGLPAGLSLSVTSTSGAGTLPGARTWAVLGIATVAPGSYPVSVTVTNDEGGVRDDGVRDRRQAGGRRGDLHRRHDRRLDGNARAAGDRPSTAPTASRATSARRR